MKFKALGCADINERFRAYIKAVHGTKDAGTGHIVHLHTSMEDQVAGSACALHPACECRFSLDTDPDIAISGTPCPPFSTQRAKRTQEGSVKAHALFYVTDDVLPKWIAMAEPKFLVLEQVRGFGQHTDPSDDSNPLERPAAEKMTASLNLNSKSKPQTALNPKPAANAIHCS